MLGKEMTIDINNKEDYPKIIDKEGEGMYLVLHLEFKDGTAYKANVESISSKGYYKVILFEKL